MDQRVNRRIGQKNKQSKDCDEHGVVSVGHRRRGGVKNDKKKKKGTKPRTRAVQGKKTPKKPPKPPQTRKNRHKNPAGGNSENTADNALHEPERKASEDQANP